MLSLLNGSPLLNAGHTRLLLENGQGSSGPVSIGKSAVLAFLLVKTVSNMSISNLLFTCDSLTMLRIEKLSAKTSTVLKLSGRIQEEHLSQLQTEIEQCTNTPKLDLKDVKLLDRPSVRFLMRCESRGIQLANCPLYIQEWISRERRRPVPQED